MKCKSWAEIGLIGWFAFSLRFDFPVLCGAPKDEYLIKPDLTLFAANYNWQWFPDSQRCHLPIKFLLLVSANTFDWWMEVELAFEIAKKVKSFFAIREIRGDTSMCLPCSPCLFMCGPAGNPVDQMVILRKNWRQKRESFLNCTLILELKAFFGENIVKHERIELSQTSIFSSKK